MAIYCGVRCAALPISLEESIPMKKMMAAMCSGVMLLGLTAGASMAQDKMHKDKMPSKMHKGKMAGKMHKGKMSGKMHKGKMGKMDKMKKM